MKIFISNLSRSATAQSLRDLFTPFGEVMSASIVMDSYTARSRGAGQVEIREQAGAERALAELHNSSFMRQTINVRELTAAGAKTFSTPK